jgi:hypothetical protein
LVSFCFSPSLTFQLYFAQLPTPLFPLSDGESISAEFKRTALIEDLEERIVAVYEMIFALPEHDSV